MGRASQFNQKDLFFCGRVRCSIGQERHELKTGDTIYSGQPHEMEIRRRQLRERPLRRGSLVTLIVS